jgi:hypothetical protein
MAKFLNDAEMDAAHDYTDQCDLMTVCNAQPTTYTEAITTFKLADVAMTPDTDFTKADGDTSGRKVTVAAKSAVPIDTSGDATHIALVRTTGTTLRAVTTCTLQALVSGNTVNIPAWDIEIRDPS